MDNTDTNTDKTDTDTKTHKKVAKNENVSVFLSYINVCVGFVCVYECLCIRCIRVGVTHVSVHCLFVFKRVKNTFS